MSTNRFPLRGKIVVIYKFIEDIAARLKSMCARGEPARPQERKEYTYEIQPLTEEEVRNLPVAHRYSA